MNPRNGSENKLGTMPVGKLLIDMSIPMMISMFVQALYNVVDSMFVARLSEDALTAVSLSAPVMNIAGAVAVGTAVGTNAYVSRCLGRGDSRLAERAANVQCFLSVVYTLLCMGLAVTFVHSFYTAQTDISVIIDYGEQYLFIVLFWSVGLFFGQNLEKLLISAGFSTLSMISQASGAVINIVLDPILIFGLGPVPAMGVSGAAWATVIGEMAASLIALCFNLRCNKAIHFRVRDMLPSAQVIRAIYAVGIPSMITIGLSAAMNYIANQILLAFSTTATAVFGIWCKMQSFGFMPVFGMNNGTLAIYSFNYGSGQYDRVRQTNRLAVIIGVCITACVTLLYIAVPRPLLALFSASDYMYAIGVPAMRICALSMPFGALCVVLSSACQALGHARYTLIVNIFRNLLLQAAAMYLLSLSGVLTAVWFAPLIAETVCALLAVILCRRVMNGLDRQ